MQARQYDNLSGVYAQLEYKLMEELKVLGAGRWDRSTLHASQFSPKLAVVWSPLVNHTFRATFNQAFQAPNYSELFLYVKHPRTTLAYLGNEDLIVEKITGYEVGYKGVVGNDLFVTVDGYFNHLKDFITDLAYGTNPRYLDRITLEGENFTRAIWSYGNAGKVDEYGFEMSANYYASSLVQLNLNYAFFEFDVKAKSQADVLLPNAPKHKINGGVKYIDDGLQLGVTVKYVPTYDWAAGVYKDGKVLAYTLVNLSGSYQISSLLDLGLNVTNLFDRKHYQILGGSFIGRRAVMSLTAKF